MQWGDPDLAGLFADTGLVGQIWLNHAHLLFYFIAFFRAAPAAYGGSQARGSIRAVAVGLHHSNVGSEPCLQPTPQLTAMPDP